MFCEASDGGLPQHLYKGGLSEISIELSIKAGVGSTDGSPLSRSISVTQNPHAGRIRCQHPLCAQIRPSASHPPQDAEVTKPASTSAPLRTRSPTGPAPCLESSQSDLPQTADPFPTHPRRSA